MRLFGLILAIGIFALIQASPSRAEYPNELLQPNKIYMIGINGESMSIRITELNQEGWAKGVIMQSTGQKIDGRTVWLNLKSISYISPSLIKSR